MPGQTIQSIETVAERDSPSADALFDALSDEHRRFVLARLCRRDEEISIASLADSLASVAGGDAQRHEISLYHRHLPKLEDAGFVAVDREERTVSATPAAATVRPHLELLSQ